MHEGTVRFEHCYRLDLESAASTNQQRACWTLWLDSYTYGQSGDRIDYARRRLNAIGSGNQEPPTLHLAGEQPTEQRQFYLVVPAPTSVHTTPPPVATVYHPNADDAGDAGGGRAPENAKSPPSDGCSASCRSAWQSCDATCGADAGVTSDAGAKKSATACACKDEYSKCMRRCFE